MDGSDICNASYSFRRSGNISSIWRNNGMDIFSQSSRKSDFFDDEEALKWATLQKLPTYNRLKKGLIFDTHADGGEKILEVDIQNLDVQQRKELLERLVKNSEGGNEKFLLKLRERIDRVGIELPQIEVRFEHMYVDAKVYVGSRALPSFLNFVGNILEGFLNYLHIVPNRKKHLSILRDLSGIIKPCRMTLLLGPPSSGKTTLLLALAGKLDHDLKTSGSVTYNGHGMHEFIPQRTAAYISQNDCHIGEMTVRETLAFSARCQGVGSRYEMLAELSRREKEANVKPDPDIDLFMKAAATEGQEANVVTDYVIKLLGLEICADTVVGSEMIRGISGGQKKRVTTGEMLVGPSNCPERKGVADFLQEVTSKQDQKQYWLHRDEPYRFITAKEFSEAYLSFHVGRRMGDDLGTPFDKSKSHPAALTTNKYGVGKLELLKACTSREILLRKRNTFVYIFKSAQLFILALITMTLFLRTEMHKESVNDGSIYMGALFFTLNPNAGRLIKQYLLLVLINQMASALFRGIAAVARSLVVASTLGSFAFLILFALGGFVLSRVNVKRWWIWGYWISPMMYGMNAIAVNEFLGHQWNHVLPNTTEPLGVMILKSRGFFPHAYWYWIGVGALLASVLLFNICFTLALSFLKPIVKPQAVIPEEGYKGRTKEGIDQQSFRDRGDHMTRNSPRFSSTRTEDNVEAHNKRKGMVLPFEPHSITFDEIKYSVDMPQEMKEQAWLRLHIEVDAGSRMMFVDEVMELVELNSLRDALVGLPGPSIDIFESFDELLLMKQGGLELYVGPVGRHSCELIKYFEEIEGISKISDGYNPATWMLEVTSTKQEMILGVDFTEVYKNSDRYRRNKALITELRTPRPGSRDLSFPTQFLFTTFIALMFGTMFWDLGTKRRTRQDIFNAMGSMYTAILFIGFQNATSVQPVVAVERIVFYRERAAGMYSSLAFALAQVLVEVPYIFLQTADLSSPELGCQYGGDGITGPALLHGHCMDCWLLSLET
ncbi:hypothetical protein POM88_038572 [Heracleum sosnowskyi]|uniref:Uncharacterized protein n=1 Tax=Heracleum sosnowskyi TaxID=360622 RepID=A0AAD8HAM2_9APIA|nr:hypothetical protein POM88_038572 [Heracleum sosnowskyi]